jgi:hypothetical protein
MKKPTSLKQFLLASYPYLEKNPDKLEMYVDAGTLKSKILASLHHRIEYTLNVIVLDMSDPIGQVTVPLLAWLQRNQYDATTTEVSFRADILDNEKVDLDIKLELTENGIITFNEDGEFLIEYQDEPLPPELDDYPLLKQFYGNNELMTPEELPE